MSVKEAIMNEIECLPEDMLEQIRRYIETVKTESAKRRHRTMRLQGQFDTLDMRKAAYE